MNVVILAEHTGTINCTGCDFIHNCEHKLKWDQDDYDIEKTFYTENEGIVTCMVDGYVFKVEVRDGK